VGDRIRVEGLSLFAHVGVYPHERLMRQRILVDLELETDLSIAGRSDRIEDTFDYDVAAEVARGVALSGHHQLIESIAELVAEGLLARFAGRGATVRVRVTKPNALPDARAVAVEITRQAP
jgi:dihydroneopterin aldolase